MSDLRERVVEALRDATDDQGNRVLHVPFWATPDEIAGFFADAAIALVVEECAALADEWEAHGGDIGKLAAALRALTGEKG